MSRYTVSVVFACLACAGCAWRSQADIDRWPHSNYGESQEVSDSHNSQSQLEVGQSREQARATLTRGIRDPMSTLAMVLRTLKPTSSFTPSGQGLHDRLANPKQIGLRPAILKSRIGHRARATRMDDVELKSGCGYDHSPLRDALADDRLEEADQITRDSLIQLAGEKAAERGYVYFTEVASIPVEDMKTLDSLWKSYSNDKFGFSVQKKFWLARQKRWIPFFQKIDWVRGEGDKYVRWRPLDSGESEFIYNVTEGVEGHLPLTNTLRGTKLIEAIFAHPAFDDVKAPSF